MLCIHTYIYIYIYREREREREREIYWPVMFCNFGAMPVWNCKMPVPYSHTLMLACTCAHTHTHTHTSIHTQTHPCTHTHTHAHIHTHTNTSMHTHTHTHAHTHTHTAPQWAQCITYTPFAIIINVISKINERIRNFDQCMCCICLLLVQPNRDHVFHITFPKEWRFSDINNLFAPYGKAPGFLQCKALQYDHLYKIVL